MDMANLPTKLTQSTELAAQQRFMEAIAARVGAGQRPDQIAREVYPTDRVKRRQLRERIWRLVRQDDEFHRIVIERAHGEMVMAIEQQTRRLARLRRPDAIKLLFEASGFHNPRVKHEHSGNIEVKLSIPRPQRELPQHVDSTAEEIPD